MPISKCLKCGRWPLHQATRASSDQLRLITRYLCPFCLDRFETSAANDHFTPFGSFAQSNKPQDDKPQKR